MSRAPSATLLFACAFIAHASFAAMPADAQTDYYNLDRGRPVHLEDASALERHAFELRVASLRLERITGGTYRWEFEPEVAYGILPRTHVSLALPFVFADVGGERAHGVAGLELSAFHNLNVETAILPAFALRADVHLPVGSLAPERTFTTVTGIATRTVRRIRMHLNAAYTFGSGDDAPDGDVRSEFVAESPSRWTAGVAVDRAFPLQSVLVIGGVYGSEPLGHGGPVQWNAEAGVRLQVSPSFGMDAGVGRSFAHDSWYATAGGALHFALRRLMPGVR